MLKKAFEVQISLVSDCTGGCQCRASWQGLTDERIHELRGICDNSILGSFIQGMAEGVPDFDGGKWQSCTSFSKLSNTLRDLRFTPACANFFYQAASNLCDRGAIQKNIKNALSSAYRIPEGFSIASFRGTEV